MKEFEAKKAEEERLREEESKKTGKPIAKAPPPKGAKPAGKDDKPQLDVPKLPAPVVSGFESVMGNKYVREREFEEIAQTLMEPPNEEVGVQGEGEGVEGTASPKTELAVPVAPI